MSGTTSAGTHGRSPERLRAHYLVERELADRLRSADRATRGRLYGEVYDELFRRVPDHPQHTRKADAATRRAEAERELGTIRRFLAPDRTLLEIGAGDCALSFAAAPHVRRAIALDVSAEITASDATPENFSLVISDGTSIPVEPGSVDVAFSNQLMEHLHPDDARLQLENVFRALAPGGVYLCVTPNRLSGPHDISAFFDETPTGFHLHEYTIGELRRLMRAAGFARVDVLARAKGRGFVVPGAPVAWIEALLARLPRRWRKRVASAPPLRQLIHEVVAHKPRSG